MKKQKPVPTAKLEFDFGSHTYRVNGVKLPHPTGLLQEFGLIDFSNVPPERLEYKRVLGMAVDLACDYLERHVLDESSLDKRILGYLNAYKKFREIVDFEPDLEKSMKPMYSKTWQFAGTNDLVGILKGEWVVVDRKATWLLYPSNAIQLMAYKILIEETYPDIKIKGRYALQLKETGSYEFQEYKDSDDRTTFLSCLQLHHWKVKNGLTKKEKADDNGNIGIDE